MTNTHKLAAFLSEFRRNNSHVSTTQVEALLLVASGVDHVSDLQNAMFNDEGKPFPRSTTNRIVNYLVGRGRYREGKWINSKCDALVQRRNHPHKQGYQLSLTEEGQKLIGAYFEG